jgi:hypothetical protein
MTARGSGEIRMLTPDDGRPIVLMLSIRNPGDLRKAGRSGIASCLRRDGGRSDVGMSR